MKAWERPKVLEPVLSAELDEVGVPKWRARLYDARVADQTPGGSGRNYDEAWAAVKADYWRMVGEREMAGEPRERASPASGG